MSELAFPELADEVVDAAPVEPTVVLAALTCECRGIYLTGYLTETQFNDIKAIFTAFTKEGSK